MRFSTLISHKWFHYTASKAEHHRLLASFTNWVYFDSGRSWFQPLSLCNWEGWFPSLLDFQQIRLVPNFSEAWDFFLHGCWFHMFPDQRALESSWFDARQHWDQVCGINATLQNRTQPSWHGRKQVSEENIEIVNFSRLYFSHRQTQSEARSRCVLPGFTGNLISRPTFRLCRLTRQEHSRLIWETQRYMNGMGSYVMLHCIGPKQWPIECLAIKVSFLESYATSMRPE